MSAIPEQASHSAAVKSPAAGSWLMFGVLLLAYSVNAMDRMIFPVLLTDIRAEYDFGLSLAGLQSTMFALGMGLTGIPIGHLLRRAPRKIVVIAGTLLFSLATFLTVVSFGFADMLVWRVLSGVGEAMQLAAILTIASTAFPRHRGLAIGAVNTAFALGSVIGPALGVALMTRYGSWRTPMIAFAFIGIVLALLVAVAARRGLTEGQPTVQAGPRVRSRLGAATTLTARNPFVIATITVLFGLIDFAYIGMYATFLREADGFTAAQAGFAVSLSGLAAFFSPLGGWIVDRFSSRLTLAGLSLAQTAAGIALFAGPADVGWQASWSFVFGLVASSGLYVGLASSMVKCMREDHASRASGTFITCIYVAAAFAGFAFSRLVGLTSWGTAGLVQIAGLSLLCAALALALREHKAGDNPSTTMGDIA